jgi:hypothetical protein
MGTACESPAAVIGNREGKAAPTPRSGVSVENGKISRSAGSVQRGHHALPDHTTHHGAHGTSYIQITQVRAGGVASRPVLASARERELSEDDFRLERVLGSAKVHGVEPLSLAEVDRVLRTRIGAALSRPTVADLQRVSGGNPFFALELGRAFIDQGRSRSAGEPLPVPDSLRDLLRARLDRLSLAACEVLFVASALSQPTTAVIEQVLDDEDQANSQTRTPRCMTVV